MTRCSVVNCLNSFVNNPARVAFFAFPHDKDVFEYWVNFTGRSNFVPNINSKICSAHFEGDAYFPNGALKPGAYPTICQTGEKPGGNISFESEEVQNRHSQEIQSNGSQKDTLSFSLNPSTVMNKTMLDRQGLNYNNASHPFKVSNSNKMLNLVSSNRNRFPLPASSEPKNTIVLNYNQNALEAGAECYVPLQIKVPISLIRMQMPNTGILAQNQLTSSALPTLNSYKQPSTHKQRQILQKGPIKFVDMKKLLQPPQEEERKIFVHSSNDEDCEIVKHVVHNKEKVLSKPHVNSKNKLQTDCASSNMKTSVVSSPNVPSKVAVSQVLDCLKVILPVKFDLSRLMPNDKVAALIIRYLKLQDNSATKNLIIMYLRIIVDAAKIKEKTARNDVKHPYFKINDIALQLALEKVLPPSFAMSDVSNLVLNCLCIVLNQDVYIDGYQILRKLIRKFINEGQHCSEIPNQDSDINTQVSEKRTINEQKEKRPMKKLKYSLIDTHASRVGKILPKPTNLHNIFLNKSEKFQPSNQTSLSKNKSVNLIFPSEMVNDDAERWEPKMPIEESLSIKSMVGTSFSKSNNTPKMPKDKPVTKVKVESEDEDWVPEEITSSHKGNPNKRNPEWEDPDNTIAITSYLERNQCSAKDILNSYRKMFYLCRFLYIKTNPSDVRNLNETLCLLAKMNKRKKRSRLTEDKINAKQKSTKQKETYTKPLLMETNGCNKLKLKPVVVLRDLIDYETEDMLFMNVSKVNSSYYNLRVTNCNKHNLSTKKYSTDHVNKVTCESFKMYRKIVEKKIGNKVIFQLKYSKLARGSLVFVKDFRNPSLGWLKGSINKIVNSLKYVVELGSGEVWWCSPEQLRPLPCTKAQEQGPLPCTKTQEHKVNLSPRSSRIIKPRQLFDL